MDAEIRNLGWVNNWRETPEIVMECNEAKHQTDVDANYHSHVTTIRCDQCNYYYRIDSSD